MGTPETSREPCPDRILDDIGGAFAMGAVGGSMYHFLRGAYNAPLGNRLSVGAQTMRMKAPTVGGGFAAWGASFSAFDCTMVYLRQKEDPWNSIIAGAATGGLLSLRQGLGSAARSAVFGGIILALIEGMGIMMTKMIPQQQAPPIMMEDSAPATAGGFGFPMGFPGQAQAHPGQGGGVPTPDVGGGLGSGGSDSGSSWFGGWFGGKNKEPATSSGGKAEILESFDAPPVPSYDYK